VNSDLRTRTDGTNKKYINRANNLLKRFKANTSLSIDDAEGEAEFVKWLIKITTNKSDSNWRQLRASCVYYFSQIDRNVLSKTIEAIDGSHAVNSSLLQATSSQKKKSVSQDEEAKIVSALLASASSSKPSYYDKPTLAVFKAMLLIGVRPSEFEHALYYDQPIEGISLQPPVVKVRNAKATNGRSFGEYRYIGLSQLVENDLRWVLMAVGYCANPTDKDGRAIKFDDYYDHLRKRIYSIGLRLFPRSKKRVTLYSARHQLIANLKASGYTLPDIACIVGHGNDVTATEYYGKKRVGIKSSNLPLANPDDIVKIRKKFTGNLPTKEHKPNKS